MNTTRAQLRADDNAGWVWLLPAPSPAQRLLCLELADSRFAEGAAFWHEHVTALSCAAGAEAVFHRGSLAGERAVAWQPGARLPYDAGAFTLVVCRLAGRVAGGFLKSLLPEIARVLSAAGCVYVDIDNPGSYQSAGSRYAGLRRGALSRVLASAGFVRQSHHAQIFEQGGLNEVIPAQGYRVTRNAWRPRERLKQLLLGKLLQRWFAPVHAVLASREAVPDAALATLPAFAGNPQFAQFLVNPGKCFVAPRAQAQGIPLITVVPTRADTITRRRTELAALERLQAARLPVAKLLPRVARELPFGRHVIFEYEAFAGTTLDLPEPHFEVSLQRALRVLVEFNRSSLQRRVLRADEFAALVMQPVEVVGQRYPMARAAAERLGRALAGALTAAAVPVVWQHGDFKLENLVFGNQDREVGAIIDWELSAPTGLALVDLLYLLAYAQITRGEHEDILQVMQVRMLPENWDPGSAALLQAYVREFPEVTPFKGACLGLFLLQHVAVRFTYDSSDTHSQSLMTELMSNIAARLETSLQHSAVNRP